MKKFKKKNKRKVRHRIAFKHFTLGGRISTLMGLASLFILLFAIYISYKHEGDANIRVGIMAFVSMLISIAGSALGLRSFYEKGTKFLKYTWIGTILNLLIVLFYVGILLIYFGGLA